MTLRGAWTLVLLGALACASRAARLSSEVQRHEADAPTCESFAQFHLQHAPFETRLLEEAPGQDLPRLSAQLGRAAKACARHALSGLVRLRERRGTEAVQAELDALTRTFETRTVDTLLFEALGPGVVDLSPMVALARETFAAERRLRATRVPENSAATWTPPTSAVPGDSTQADGRAVLAPCTGRPPEPGARCLFDAHEAGFSDTTALEAAARTLAQRLLADEAKSGALERAASLERFLSALPTPSLAAGLLEVQSALSQAADATWPSLDMLAQHGRVAAAAASAKPFARLPAFASRVAALRQRAAAHHAALAKAAAAAPLAALVHSHLAAFFSETPPPALAAPPGTWDTSRLRCEKPPRLPTPPPGLAMRLVGQCRREGAPKQDTPSALKTFDTEAGLRWERVEGEVLATCEGAVERRGFAVRDVVLDDAPAAAEVASLDASGPGQAVQVKVSELLREVSSACRARAAAAATQACARLTPQPDFATEARFTEWALRLGAWSACYAAHFERQYGVAPPALRGQR